MEKLPEDNEIAGVLFKQLRSYPDDRGFFREVIRSTDSIFDANGFQQWSHSKMTKNVVKAWHYHHVQTDWWYIPIGSATTALVDNRPDSPTYKTKLVFKMGEEELGANVVCVKIPPGVLHGCRVNSEIAHLFYITSQTYDPNDEGRIPYDSELVDHDWGIDAITSENDKKTFAPTAPAPTFRLV